MTSTGAKLGDRATSGKSSSAVMMLLDYNVCPATDKIEEDVDSSTNTVENSFAVIDAALKSISAAATQEDMPRLGMLTYAFARSASDPYRLHFTELFADVESQSNHLTENEGEAIVEMYSRKMLKLRSGVSLNVPPEEDMVRFSQSMMVGAKLCQARGQLMHRSALYNRWFKKHPQMRPSPSLSMMIELRVQPNDDDTDRADALEACDALIRNDVDDFSVILSSFIVDNGWWVKGDESDDYAFTADRAIGVYFTVPQATGQKATSFTRKKLYALKQKSKHVELIVTASTSEVWENGDAQDLFEWFEDNGILLVEKRDLFAGFIFHPAFCQGWNGINPVDNTAKNAAKKPDNASASTSTVPSETKVEPEPTPSEPSKPGLNKDEENPEQRGEEKITNVESEYFTIRYHVVSGSPEAIVFKRNKTGVVKVSKDEGDKTIRVPLLLLLRKLAFISPTDKEVPFGIVYAQFGRLKHLLNSTKLLNEVSDDEINDNEVLSEHLRRFLESLSSFGYTMPGSGRVPVYFEGVEDLVKALSIAYKDVIDVGTRARDSKDEMILYMALHEFYQIDDIVTTRSVGGLGGAVIALRIDDSYYEPMRSL